MDLYDNVTCMTLAVQKRGKMKSQKEKKNQALIPAPLKFFLQKHLSWKNDDERK